MRPSPLRRMTPDRPDSRSERTRVRRGSNRAGIRGRMVGRSGRRPRSPDGQPRHRTHPERRYTSTHTKRRESLGQAARLRAREGARAHQQGVHRPLQPVGLRGQEPLGVPRRRLRGHGAPQGRDGRPDPGRAARRGDPRQEEGCSQEGTRQEGTRQEAGRGQEGAGRGDSRASGPSSRRGVQGGRRRGRSGGLRTRSLPGGGAGRPGSRRRTDRRSGCPPQGRVVQARQRQAGSTGRGGSRSAACSSGGAGRGIPPGSDPCARSSRSSRSCGLDGRAHGCPVSRAG